MEEYDLVRCANCGCSFYAHLVVEEWHFYMYHDTWLSLLPLNLDEIDDCPGCGFELDYEGTLPFEEKDSSYVY